MKQLRAAAGVILSAITAKGSTVVNFARSFTMTRSFNWTPEGGIGSYYIQEFVLNSVDGNFSQGRATVFNQTLTEMGLIPTQDEFTIFEPINYQVTDIVTGATFALIQMAVITSQQQSLNRATTIADTFNGLCQYWFTRDEIEGGATI